MKRAKLPDGVFLIDLQQVFERVCVEEGAKYRNQHHWNHDEVSETVNQLVAEFKATLEEFANHVESGDIEALEALARQENTQRLLRATLSGAVRPSAGLSG